jgi:DNA-binding NarL/FixJ family response regulator
MGEKLFVNKRTVDFSLTHVSKKLDVHDRIEAYWRSQELGIFSDEAQTEHPERTSV